MKKNNNWYVITGGPCSGKTTVADILVKKGYKVIYEMARFYIDQEIKKGRTLEQIRENEYQFQKKLVELKVEKEKTLPKNELIFIERGIPDSTAYYRQSCHIEKDNLLKKALKNCTYKKVFLFELLDYQKDYARTESSTEALNLEYALEESYKELGLEVIRVPKMSIKERVKFVLSRVN